MTATTSQAIAHIVGPVAAREFDNAKDTYKQGLYDWSLKLPKLSDADFANECSQAIYSSAQVNSFRGNWDHEHFKATACYHEAERRHKADGHDDDCRRETVYAREHRRLMRDHGYATQPPSACTCK